MDLLDLNKISLITINIYIYKKQVKALVAKPNSLVMFVIKIQMT